jgi:uncharacterized protein (DUF58 family)
METTELLRKVRKIEIKAKGKTQDIYAGAYHTAFKGRGMSYSETRMYQYGDDIRNIDWNVTARNEDTYVKVFEEERELTVMLLVDLSASNEFGSTSSKKEYIAELAATIAVNALKNNDKVGAILFSNGIDYYLPPKKGKGGALRMIREIVNADSKTGPTYLQGAMDMLMRIQKKRAVCFILSDFIAENYEQSLKMLKHSHDVVTIRIADDAEYNLPNIGLVHLYNPETKMVQLVDTSDKEVRTLFGKQSNAYLTQFEAAVKKNNLGNIKLTTQDDFVKSMIKFFKRR